MEQIVLASKELCTGCQACYSICPKQAIEMKINREGFYYPKIDEDKCIKYNEQNNNFGNIFAISYDGIWAEIVGGVV